MTGFNNESLSFESNRRKLLLGAPAALLLSACGGGDGTEGSDTVASVSRNVEIESIFEKYSAQNSGIEAVASSKAVVDAAEAFADGFVTFYNTKFSRFQTACSAHALWKVSGQNKYGSEEIEASITVATRVYDGLSAAKKTEFNNLTRSYLILGTPIDIKPKYTQLELVKKLEEVAQAPDAHLNLIKQRKPYIWHDLVTFLSSTQTPASFKVFTDKVDKIEKNDDQRHLKGATPDSVAIEPGAIYGEKETFKVKLGNLRKPVERAELVSTRPFYLSWLSWIFGQNYTDESKIQAGVNSTTVEPKFTAADGYTVTSDGMRYLQDQKEGIEYYVHADFIKNGPVEGLNETQTKRLLTELTEYVFRETGMVYESYVAAQYGLRAVQQAVVGFARYKILNKSIDLEVLKQTLADAMTQNADIKYAFVAGRTEVLNVARGLLTLSMANIVLSALMVKAVNEVATNNQTETVVQQTARVTAKLTTWLTATQTVASYAAIGILVAGTIPARSTMKEQIQRAIPGAFAVSDLTAGIADILTVFKQNKQKTPDGAVLILAGLSRFTTTTVTIVDNFYKLVHWDYSKRYFTTISALQIATMSSAVSCAAYTLAAVYSVV